MLTARPGLLCRHARPVLSGSRLLQSGDALLWMSACTTPARGVRHGSRRQGRVSGELPIRACVGAQVCGAGPAMGPVALRNPCPPGTWRSAAGITPACAFTAQAAAGAGRGIVWDGGSRPGQGGPIRGGDRRADAATADSRTAAAGAPHGGPVAGWIRGPGNQHARMRHWRGVCGPHCGSQGADRGRHAAAL